LVFLVYKNNILEVVESIEVLDYSFWGDIKTSMIGYESLLQFFNICNKHKNKKIRLNFTKLKWFDANMSANLILFCNILKTENNLTFEIVSLKSCSISDVLMRNNFFKMITNKDELFLVDINESTISLGNYNGQNGDAFVNYIEKNFINHRSLHNLAEDEKINLRNNYFEIFDNIDTHANSSVGCFVCGQMFPSKRLTKFTIVDYGDGFLKKIASKTLNEVVQIKSYSDAIIWALQGNTTKINEPGGTGLSGVLKYCHDSGSSMQIISGDSFFEFVDNKKIFRSINNNIKGTTINLILKN
jgi:hypothetical protein